MSTSDGGDEVHDDGPSTSAWGGLARWSWPIAAVVAFVVFEVTSSPSLAVALGCLKFGWHDFRVARAIRRADPDPIRGRVCARFRFAWGLLKVSLMAVFMMVFIMIAFHELLAARNQAVARGWQRQVQTAFLVACLGLGLTVVVTTSAVVPAWRHRVKVWLGGEENRLKPALVGSMIAFFLMSSGSAVVLLVATPNVGNKVPDAVGAVIGVVIGVGMPIGVALTLLVGLELILRRIEAKTPAECWPVPLDFSRPSRPRDRHDPFAGEADRGFVID